MEVGDLTTIQKHRYLPHRLLLFLGRACEGAMPKEVQTLPNTLAVHILLLGSTQKFALEVVSR